MRRTALAILIALLLLAGCGGARPQAASAELQSADPDAALQAMMEAFSDGREQLSLTVSADIAAELDSDTLWDLFNTAYLNDAGDMPIYPATSNRTLTEHEDGGYTAVFSLGYGELSAREYTRCKAEYEKQLDEYAAALTALGEAPARLYRTIYFLVCQHTEYDTALAEATVSGGDAIKSADALKLRGPYGALVERSSICTGYAMLYKALCDRLGLPCWVVIGSADGVTHAWNLIIVDGEIRYIDTTNGDRDAEPNADFCIMHPLRYRTLGRAIDQTHIPKQYYDAGHRD